MPHLSVTLSITVGVCVSFIVLLVPFTGLLLCKVCFYHFSTDQWKTLAHRHMSIPKSQKAINSLSMISNGSLKVTSAMNSVSSQSRADVNKKWFDRKLELKRRMMRVRWHDVRLQRCCPFNAILIQRVCWVSFTPLWEPFSNLQLHIQRLCKSHTPSLQIIFCML